MKKKIIITMIGFILFFYTLTYAAEFIVNIKYNIKSTYQGTILFDPTKFTNNPYEIELLKDVPVSIYEISKDNDVRYNFTFKENSDYNNLVVIASSYNYNNRLLNYKINTYNYINNTDLNDELYLITENINDVYKFKLFIFDNLNNIKPLVNNFEKLN